MKQFFYFIFFNVALFFNVLNAQSAYEIKATIDGFEGDTAYLAFRYGDKTYSKDTTAVENGAMIFKGEKKLATGVYLVLMPPENKWVEFLVSQEDQHFSLKTNLSNLFKDLSFEGSTENEIFTNYRFFINQKGKANKELQTKITAETNDKKRAKFQARQTEMAKEVKTYQNKIITEHKNTFAAKLIRSFQDIDVPEAPILANGRVDSTFQLQYYKKHYFDNIDFSEQGFLNSTYFKPKIDRYVDKIITQMPDSVIIAVELILSKAKANPKVFRYTLSHFLTKYHRPKVVGMDEVFVHLADKYYRTGIADWPNKEQLKKITDDAYMIKGVLIGNRAQNVRVQQYDYTKQAYTKNMISLYDVKADYTVVFLWKPGCPHCDKMAEDLKEFYATHKDKGVEIFAITSATRMDLAKAQKALQEKDVSWINTADPNLKARALQKFYGTSLPKLYVLDKNKIIISSRIGVEQLSEVIKQHINKKS